MFGLIDLPWWGYIFVIIGLGQITNLAVTLYLHRCQAHRALALHPIVSHFFRFWLWITTAIITKEWTAVHRKHHARVEGVEDPHSPQIYGIKTLLLEGADLYAHACKDKESIARYGEGTPDDWMERHVYTRHPNLGITLMLIIDIALFGTLGLTVWALQMAWIPFFAGGVINGIGHYWGYRNFECKDASRNVIPWGVFLGGEELHNNHHAFATSAKFSAKWWEVDIGWYAICFMQVFGLAKPRRVLHQPRLNPAKNVIDIDTLKAIIAHRFQIMSRYAREVVLPVLREEKKRAGKTRLSLLRRAGTILVRDASIMKASQILRLNAVLDNFYSLRIIYQFRLRLQDIWSRKTASQKELLEALQDWCHQAEATGIETLLNFARHLKTYVPQEVAR